MQDEVVTEGSGGLRLPAVRTNTGSRPSFTGVAPHGSPPKPNKMPSPPGAAGAKKDGDQTSIIIESNAELLKAERPEERVVHEIVGCLKMKSSMLAMGACERVKKIARVYPVEVANSAIMEELVGCLKEGPATALAGAVMQALSIMALNPEGRQRVCLAGAAGPLIRFIRTSDLSRPNLDRAVTLLMNLAADQTNRRTIREEGGVEALVELLRVAPIGESIMEHALGALHNLALMDAKSRSRAMEAGVLLPLVRIVTCKGLPDADMCGVRGRMILTELLKMPETEERLAAAAMELGVRI
ncbi:hypothetical protein Agub_g1637 [Astrephomene gubernaculifera]|uniref:Uncharacterized protein n=1 Tax=Astrephomene gubernaculifera TaxID=47775 RepID=A0AAD3HHF9_9CHLO|nr:hypothetical protein Agub_g1637 [Astrephomene gubernaculifera]